METQNSCHFPLTTPVALVPNTVKSELWLSVGSFSMLADIGTRRGRRALSRAANGLAWKKHHLTVRVVASQGGTSGERYEVLATSLPPELYGKWLATRAEQPPIQALSVTLPTPLITHDPAAVKRSEKALWILSIISPILGLPRYTSERTAAIASVLSQEYTRPDGKTVRVSQSQLYEWLKRYASDHIDGLKPRQRKDIGKRRVLIARGWDAACPLDREAKEAIAKSLAAFIASLWAGGASGWNVIRRFADLKLEELSRAAGWNAPLTEMKAACVVTRHFIEEQRKHKLLATLDKDAKQFFDVHIPRIRRSRADLRPMDVVVGDVHPIDIALTRPDGSVAYPRGICWHDVATNRLYATLVLLEKGEGIKQVHIAASFAQMCAEWGQPLTLYLDNGSEYSWHEMMAAFAEISRLTQALQRQFRVGPLQAVGEMRELVAEQRQVIRAMPYNAPAKPIEGLFSVIENTVLSMIPGWTGGDRMRAKTHNVGHAPQPYPGTWDQFNADFATALAFYHTTPQNGTMNGLSPNDVFRAHVKAGWTKTRVDEQVLLMAFADEDTRKAQGGYVSWNGVEYYDDALLPLTGQTVIVRVARHDPRYAFIFDKTRALICAAGVAPVYGFLDPAGAEEQARRKKVLMRHISKQREGVSRLDLVDEMNKVVNASAPMPQPTVGATVGISEEATQMVKALQAKDMAALAEEEGAKTVNTNIKRLSQWSSSDEPDPYVDAVKFEDE